MATAKSKQIAKEIENARCLGNWQAIPELARRYKKHEPQGSILAQTIVAEATLSQLCSSDQRRQNISSIHGHDTPGDISLSPRLDAAKVKSLQLELQSVLRMDTTDPKLAAQKEFAKIILARSYYESGDYKAALDIVQHLAFDKSSVSSGYNFILFLQARTIKAVCLELTGDIASSLATYEAIATLLAEVQSAKDRVLIDWVEHGLYRGSLLSLGHKTQVSPSSVLEILRAYQRITAAQNITWRLAKRLNVTRYSFAYLTDIYRQGKYTATAPRQNDEKQNGTTEQSTFVTEILGLHTIYEKMLTATSTIPRPNQLNIPVLEYADLVAETIGLVPWSPRELKGFVDILYRATQKTFNSPRVTRHLFNALVTLGEYEEAQHAYRTYLFLIGLSSEAQDQSRATGEALARDSEAHNIPLPTTKREQIDRIIKESRCKVEGAARRSLASQRSLEQESVEDILQTLLTGITMLYSSLYRSADAVELSELAIMLYEMSSGYQSKKNWAALGSRVYCIAGAAHGFLASQVVDPVARPKYHEKAQIYLEKSVEIDPSNWKAFYQLALEQSEIRDTQKAMQSVGRALQLNPSDIPCWHLLTLLCSCPVQGDLKRALEACEMGLERVREQRFLSRENDNVDLGALPDYDEAEQHILLQMTHTMLCGKLYGPEEALRVQHDVFAAYTRIAIPEGATEYSQAMTGLYERPKGMVVSGSLENLSENTTTTNDGSNESISKDQQQRNGSTRLSQRSSQSLKTSSDEASVTPPTTQHNHHKRLHPHLHLFRSKSRIKTRKDHLSTNGLAVNDEKKHASLYSASNGTQTTSQPGSLLFLQSAAMSLSSTRSIVPRTDAQQAAAEHYPTTRSRLRQRRSIGMLCELWLLSAAYFLQLGRLDEAQKAIEEAENMNWTSHAGVWCMLGRLRLAEGNKEGAIASFQKGLTCDQNDNDCKLWLAKTYMELDDLEIAEGLLDTVTKETGWNNPEAWTYLGKIFSVTARPDRAKDCFLYALELEQTQPIRPFSILPRCK